MNKQFLIFLSLGLLFVAILVGGLFYANRGAHVELKGQILKVRTMAADERSSIAVIDFRFVNPADYPFIVRHVNVSMEDAAGNRHEGKVVSEVDAKRLFEYYPILGQKFNETLLMRDKVNARQSMDRMVAVRFEAPEPTVAARKHLTIRVEDVDGPVSEISESE